MGCLQHEASPTSKPSQNSAEVSAKADMPVWTPSSVAEKRRGCRTRPCLRRVSKSLLSALRMLPQSAVSETKPLDGAVLIDDINDAAGVQRMEPEIMHRNRNLGSHLYRSDGLIQVHPRDIEPLPPADRRDCPAPRNLAFSKENAIVVHVVPSRDVTERRADF